MNDENTTPTEQDQKPATIPWKEQPRMMKRIIIGIALLAAGILWTVLELNADSRWVVFGIVPASWFSIFAGAATIVGEAIKKPGK